MINNPYSGLDWINAIYAKSETHAHTTESDGDIYGAALIDMYADNGYKFLAITDHDNYRPAKTPRENGGTLYLNTFPWTIFEGVEVYQAPVGSYTRNETTGLVANGLLTASSTELSKNRHLVVIDTDYQGDANYTNNGALLQIRNSGAIAIIAHPQWPTVMTKAELLDHYANHSSNYLVGQEVFAGLITEADLLACRTSWDSILTELMPHRNVWGFGASDTHTDEAYQCYTTVLVETLTLEDWKQAVRNGQFYISVEPLKSGEAKAPSIQSIVHDENAKTITVNSSDATTIQWVSIGNIVYTGATLNYGTTSGISKYVRAELINEFGSTYTQPIAFNC